MTDKNKLYATEISNFLSNKDYDSIYFLFTKTNFSPSQLIIFYKSRREILTEKDYWITKLPHFHLNEVIESDFKVEFLKHYFSREKNCNDEFNKHLTIIAKEDFIKFIKLWGIFNKPKFFNSLKAIAKTDSEIERFVKELEIVIKAQEKNKKEEEIDKKLILEHSFDEIALAFSLFYYDFKQHPHRLSDKKRQTEVEMALVHGLDNIISIFKEQNNVAFQFGSNIELQEVFERNEAPHHTFGKKSLTQPVESKYKKLYALIDRMINRNSRNVRMQLFLAGYFDFESTVQNPAPLKSNHSYRLFQINDNKSSPEESYFIDRKMGDSSNPKLENRTDINSSINCLNFYGIPEFVTHQGNEIEVKKALKLLQFFSVYKGPKERVIFPDKTFLIMNQGDEKFIELFGSNESITLFEHGNLVKGISTYFAWNEEETLSILSLLTFDPSSINFCHSWISRPFLKYQNQVLWLGSFLKDRRWENIFLNKFKRDTEFKPIVNLIATNFEKKIEELFKSSGFKTISSLRFESANEQKGDFDVLAFKDNYLIVCEAKTGLRTDEFVHASKTEAMRLEGKAADQLIKAIHNIKEDWSNLKTKLKLSASLKIEDIEIIPLIITDNFEGDLRLYKKTILKTSLLELEVNLKNKKRELLELYLMEQPYMNSLNKDFKDNNMNSINWDLSNGENECSVKNLIKNIEENAIWKELETVWKFENLSLSLDY